MRNGCVKWFDNRKGKGYGFISDFEDGKGYFFHYTDIVSDKEFKSFFQNEHVTFDTKENDRGLCAFNVTKVKRVK